MKTFEAFMEKGFFVYKQNLPENRTTYHYGSSGVSGKYGTSGAVGTLGSSGTFGSNTTSGNLTDSEVQKIILEYGLFDYDFTFDTINSGVLSLTPNVMKYLISELRQNESLIFVVKSYNYPHTIFWENNNEVYKKIRLVKNEPVKRYIEKKYMLMLHDQIINDIKKMNKL